MSSSKEHLEGLNEIESFTSFLSQLLYLWWQEHSLICIYGKGKHRLCPTEDEPLHLTSSTYFSRSAKMFQWQTERLETETRRKGESSRFRVYFRALQLVRGIWLYFSLVATSSSHRLFQTARKRYGMGIQRWSGARRAGEGSILRFENKGTSADWLRVPRRDNVDGVSKRFKRSLNFIFLPIQTLNTI